MKGKTPLLHNGYAFRGTQWVCFQGNTMGMLSGESFIFSEKLLLSQKLRILQRGLFLTMFYTISSPLLMLTITLSIVPLTPMLLMDQICIEARSSLRYCWLKTPPQVVIIITPWSVDMKKNVRSSILWE